MPEEAGSPRIKFYIGMTLAVFALLVFRLAYLQVALGDQMAAQAERNCQKTIRVNAPRGVFYDRNLEPLVTNRLAFALYAVPEDLSDPGSELAYVSKLLNLPQADLEKKLKDSKSPPYEGVVLASNLDQTSTLRLAEAQSKLPGIVLQETPVRYYPRGDFACHLFGYVGEINQSQLDELKDQGYRMGQTVGKDGLEREYDRILQGTDGGSLIEVDHLGNPKGNVGSYEPTPGDGLVLTIDADLQEAAEKALADQLKHLRDSKQAPEASAGAVIAMDPKTGEILAMTSQPGFDPNLFVGGISSTDYRKLADDPNHPFTDRVVAGEYSPGSTFKVITGMAALSEGKVTLDDRFVCTGYDPVYPKKKCWTVGKTAPHGVENIIDGFKNSCNIVFYELGRRVGPDVLAKYARMFGLGEPTGVGLPGESNGLVPDTDWKKANYNEPWYMPETMDFAIGQGFLTVTPVQLAQVYMAIANGGTIYKPSVVREILSPDGDVLQHFAPQVSRQVKMDPQSLDIVRQGLDAVTGDGGTASQAFIGSDVKVAGKTGSVQISQGPSHGWFAGMAPADNPDLVVVVIIEHGESGASAAAPVARKVFDAYFAKKNAQANDTEHTGTGTEVAPQ